MKNLLETFFTPETIKRFPLPYQKFDIVINKEKLDKMEILFKESTSINFNTTKMKVQSCYKPISRIISLKEQK